MSNTPATDTRELKCIRHNYTPERSFSSTLSLARSLERELWELRMDARMINWIIDNRSKLELHELNSRADIMAAMHEDGAVRYG